MATVAIPGSLFPLIKQASIDYKVPIDLIVGLLSVESGFKANALGPMTKYGQAKGIAQFIDDTSRTFKLRDINGQVIKVGIDPYNVKEAIPAAAQYLADEYKRFGNWEKAVTAYHSGRGNVLNGTLGPNGLAYGPAVYKRAGMEWKGDWIKGKPSVISGSTASVSPQTTTVPVSTEPTVTPATTVPQPTLTPEQQQEQELTEAAKYGVSLNPMQKYSFNSNAITPLSVNNINAGWYSKFLNFAQNPLNWGNLA